MVPSLDVGGFAGLVRTPHRGMETEVPAPEAAQMTDYGTISPSGPFSPRPAPTRSAWWRSPGMPSKVGLDLVTFRDHPYLPKFLDTWTLLSYVAASTSRPSARPSVLKLPLRLPAVLARAGASLDLLSGGRLELGVCAGAGAFWDAMEAMGAQGRMSCGAEPNAPLGRVDARAT